MNESSLHPSRLLKAMAWLARWSLGLLLVVLVLLVASWGTLHGWIVPRIGDYRVQLENQAQSALGVPVRIGAVSARSDSLIPTLELTDVALLDSAGRVALQLQRVVVAVSPRSLWRLGFEQLYIERPELDIRRTAEGNILVAGLPFSSAAAGDTRAADWLFSQSELVVRGGTVRWHDELRKAPVLALDQVDVLLRNGQWRHSVRVDATLPSGWGNRFVLMGKFRQPLLGTRSGHWQRWSGQAFAQFDQIDVARLGLYTDLGKSLASGQGALQAWVDVERGRAVGGTADVALSNVNATLGEQLSPLVLASVQGRLGGRVLPGGFEFSTQGLGFVTGNGLRWPGGNFQVKYSDGTGKAPEQGELSADRMDLAALARIAERLPLGDKARQILKTYAPRGQVQTLRASWRGSLEAVQSYRVLARISALDLGTGVAPPTAQGRAGREAANPVSTTLGVRGAAVDLEMTQAGGRASLAIADGALLLPGVFEDPWVPLSRLQSAVSWQVDGAHVSLQVAETQFANSDAKGVLRATWHTSAADASRGRSGLPGVLDLSGKLDRADGARVHRYLPLVISAQARNYVRDAVVAGKATSVDFRVQGDLHDMPFVDSRQGIFRIAAKVKEVTYSYVPVRVQQQDALPWPPLTQLDGELLFEGASMRINASQGAFEGARTLQLGQVQAHIAELAHPVVEVNAQARGSLAEMLGVVKTSPLAALTGHALDHAAVGGNAALQLNLSLPVASLHQAKVRGSVTLANNDVRITPDTPRFSSARGMVHFTENGFALQSVQAQVLGGEMQLEGGMQALSPQSPPEQSALRLRAQGVASAQGLRDAKELGLVSQLAHRAQGSAAYTIDMGLRRGIPELRLTSTLQGLALDLPAPLGKTATSALPVHFERVLSSASLRPSTEGQPMPPPLHDQLKLELGKLGALLYVRDVSGVQTKVLRGSIALGLGTEERISLPVQGVIANVQLELADLDAWEAVLANPLAVPSAATSSKSTGSGIDVPQGFAASPGTMSDYLPTTVALRATTLKLKGRTLHKVVMDGVRVGNAWRATMDARELGGYIEYLGSGSPQFPEGRLFARLAHMTIPPSDTTDSSDQLLDSPTEALPELDIVVNAFQMDERKLGRLEVQAINRFAQAGEQREWQLRKFNMQTPEATLTAKGRWAPRKNAKSNGPDSAIADRHTELNFRLEIQDAGLLLERFGLHNAMRSGKGQIEGSLGWEGGPLTPDYPSMTGQLQLGMGSGQFLKAELGAAKLLSVLSLQSLPRRLNLDFRDVFSKGFAFDFLRGDVSMKNGIASTNNLQMKGLSAAVLMEGSADIVEETQSLHVVVIPEINAMTASLIATAINPLVGLGTFLAQAFLRGPLMAAATQEFQVEGTWAEPDVRKLSR